MAAKDADWTKTGTVEGYAEWIRKKADAHLVVVVRVDDAVLVAHPDVTTQDAIRLIEERIPELALLLNGQRNGKRQGVRLVLEPIHE